MTPRFHGVVHHGQQVGPHRAQVHLLAQARTERGQGLRGIVLAAIAEHFESDDPTIGVPYDTLTGTIDILQAMIALWQHEYGSEPDHELWGHLMGAAGLALGKLVEAYARERSADGRSGKELMHQIIARNLELNKQRQGRTRQEHKPAAKNDPGWEF